MVALSEAEAEVVGIRLGGECFSPNTPLRRAGCRSRSAAESSLHFDLCKIGPGPHEAHPLTVSCTQGMGCGDHLEIRPDIVEVGTTTMGKRRYIFLDGLKNERFP